jgi:hypothetical protein
MPRLTISKINSFISFFVMKELIYIRIYVYSSS